jgi:hypothetical protein
VLIDSGIDIDIDIDIGIAIEIDIGSIGEDLDNDPDPDPDPDPDFDFDGLDRAALQILDASVRCRPLKDLEVRQRSVRYAASKGACSAAIGVQSRRNRPAPGPPKFR